MKRITIEPISRIEGHGKITIQLDDDGHVAGAEFHVTQIRGFEKFTEGRPFYEMPGITARICGICPISHLLASSKACDAIMAVRIPPAARKLRELVHCAQIVQSHALSFFYLSAPDFLLGMVPTRPGATSWESSPTIPNWRATGSNCASSDCRWSKAWRRSASTPPGLFPAASTSRLAPRCATVFSPICRQPRRLSTRTIPFFKRALDNYRRRDRRLRLVSNHVCRNGRCARATCSCTMAACVFAAPSGEIVEDQIAAEDYKQWIGEASLQESYLKAPYFMPQGFPAGVYRVGPLGAHECRRRAAEPPRPIPNSANSTSDSGQSRTARSSITTRG